MTRRAAIPAIILLAALAACLAPGCTELGSLPTEPVAPDQSRWTETYAPLAQDNLNAVWAMDSDDVWIAGGRSTILHYDGENLVRHDPGVTDYFDDIDGCATDEVWAVGDNAVVRWNGRTWSVVEADDWRLQPRAVLCEAPDRVYVGARVYSSEQGWRAVVRRYTGRGQKDWALASEESWIEKLWRPHAGSPLHAIVVDSTRHAYRIDDGRWVLLDWPGVPLDADGDLVLLDNDEFENPQSLYRLEPDHTLTSVCGQFLGSRILRARVPLVGFSRGIQYVAGCLRRSILEATPYSIRDIALPVRPGPASRTIFVVGGEGSVMVGGWRDDWSVDWRQLSPHDSYDLYGPVLGDGENVFVPYIDQGTRGVFVQSASGWHTEALDYIPEGLRFLANGDLLVWNEPSGSSTWGVMHVRSASGTWRELPDTQRKTRGVWGSGEDDLVAMTLDGEFLVLEGDTWVVRNELGGACTWFDGTAADRLYATIELPRLRTRRLLQFDGIAWRDITPPGVQRVEGCYLGPHTGTVYAYCRSANGYDYRKYRDGQWEDFPETEGIYVDVGRLLEAADGGLYLRDSREISRWHPGGWKTMYEFEESLRYYSVHPDRGLHVIDNRNRIFHHPYRPR